MKKFSLSSFAAATVALSFSAASQAAILTSSATSPAGGGCGTAVAVSSIATLPAPNGCTLYAFNELQNVTLGSVLPAGNVGPAGALAAGTLVNSHLIAWNPPGSDSVNAEITFDGMILAVYTQAAQLNATTGVLGLVSPTIVFTNGQGLEGNDSVTVGTDGVSLRFSATNPGDYIRVVTAVPLPGAAPLLALGLLGLAAVRRKA